MARLAVLASRPKAKKRQSALDDAFVCQSYLRFCAIFFDFEVAATLRHVINISFWEIFFQLIGYLMIKEF